MKLNFKFDKRFNLTKTFAQQLKKAIYLLIIPIILISCMAFAGWRVDVVKKHVVVDKSIWMGDWEIPGRMAGATLHITSATADSLQFNLTANNGGNVGEIEGSAVIKQNEAIYKSAEDGCKLTMRLNGHTILISTTACEANAGMGVSFDGKYISTPKLPKQKPETFMAIHLLNAKEDAALHALVGANYQRFMDCTQLTAAGNNKDIDNLNTRVIRSGVRGLYTQMEQIIMVGKQQHIWAAVISDDDQVLYFTNDKAYAGKLPKTINQWRANFKDYPVIYKSQN